MSEGTSKHPAFFCPRCRQKHRLDPSPLRERQGAVLRTRCRGCEAPLVLRLEGDELVCTLAVEEAPAPHLGGPYEADVDLTPGTRAGRYEIEGLLRRGATAVVYRARDPETKRAVALKVLRGEVPRDAKERFQHQIEVQGRIRHPNVLSVYDRGILADGRPFFAMELLQDSLTLSEVLARRAQGQLGSSQALAPLATVQGLVERILVPIAEGIYVANVENNVLHRDLRPENVFVDGVSGRPYVGDFGYAVRNPDASPGEPAPTSVPLSPFLAPESADGRTHPRTDVHGLGAILYAMLTGRPPLEGKGDELLGAARNGTIEPLSEDVPPALAAIARKALNQEPDQRYVNARQMAADLRAWLGGGAVRAAVEAGDRGTQRLETRAHARRVLRGLAWVAGGLLIGLLLGSRIRLGGEAGTPPSVLAAAEDVDRLDREVSSLAERLPNLRDDTRARLWADVHARGDAIRDALALAPPGDAQGAVLSRLDYVLGRLVVPRVRFTLPEGVTLRASSKPLGREWAIEEAAEPVALPPGPLLLESTTFPFRAALRLDLGVRAPGARGEAPVVEVALPDEARSPPPGTTLVLGGPVAVERLPWSPREGEAIDVPSFLLDRRPVSNDEFARYLSTLSRDEQQTRMPAQGFSWDEARGYAEVANGVGPAPVIGVRPSDAEAFASWRAAQEGRVVRLPTEAEWVLAAGGAVLEPALGAYGPAPSGGSAALGLLEPPPEIVTTTDGGFLLKGGGGETAGPAEVIFRRDAAGDGGFRLVREFRTEAASRPNPPPR